MVMILKSSYMLCCLGLYWENGKENGNYRDYRGYIGYVLGLYWENGKENGNYFSTLGKYWDIHDWLAVHRPKDTTDGQERSAKSL